MFVIFIVRCFLCTKQNGKKKRCSVAVFFEFWSALSMTVPLEVVECNSDVFNFKDIN